MQFVADADYGESHGHGVEMNLGTAEGEFDRDFLATTTSVLVMNSIGFWASYVLQGNWQ